MEFLRFITASIIMLVLMSFDYSPKKREGTVIEQKRCKQCWDQVDSLRDEHTLQKIENTRMQQANKRIRDSLQIYILRTDSLTASIEQIRKQLLTYSGSLASDCANH